MYKRQDWSRKYKREISLEYLTEEKHHPLGTNDKCFQAPEPDEEYIPVSYTHLDVYKRQVHVRIHASACIHACILARISFTVSLVAFYTDKNFS